MRIHFI